MLEGMERYMVRTNTMISFVKSNVGLLSIVASLNREKLIPMETKIANATEKTPFLRSIPFTRFDIISPNNQKSRLS